MIQFLNEKELKLLNEHRTESRYKAQELIIKQGTPSKSVVFLTQGLVKVFVEGLKDKDIIVSIVKPVQYISGPELYFNKTYNYSVVALTNTECCFIDNDIFKKLVWDNRSFADAFLSEFSRRSMNTLHSLVSLTQKNMHGRIAEGLLYLSKVFDSDTFDMVLSKKELGELTSMTRESAIRILAQLKDEGVIEMESNFISIKERQKLIDISNIG